MITNTQENNMTRIERVKYVIATYEAKIQPAYEEFAELKDILWNKYEHNIITLDEFHKVLAPEKEKYDVIEYMAWGEFMSSIGKEKFYGNTRTGN